MLLLLSMSYAAAAAAASPPHAAAGALPPAFATERFEPVASLAGLPPRLRRALDGYVYGKPLADPGAPWEATDVITDPALPRRRLAFAGTGPTLDFVLYEHGGRGTHDHLLLFARTGEDDALAYACVGFLPRTLDKLRKAVAKGHCRTTRRNTERG